MVSESFGHRNVLHVTPQFPRVAHMSINAISHQQAFYITHFLFHFTCHFILHFHIGNNYRHMLLITNNKDNHSLAIFCNAFVLVNKFNFSTHFIDWWNYYTQFATCLSNRDQDAVRQSTRLAYWYLTQSLRISLWAKKRGNAGIIFWGKTQKQIQ